MSRKKRKKFKPPKKVVSKKKVEENENSDDSEVISQYWSCNYTNHTRKKHKNWLTGFIVLKGQKMELFDCHGKSHHSKTIVSKKYESGDEIFSRGKHIELDDIISKEDFESGKLFEQKDSDEEDEEEDSAFKKASNKRWEKFQQKMEVKKKKKEKKKRRARKRKKAKKLGIKVSLSSSDEEEDGTNDTEIGNMNVDHSIRVRKPFKKVIPKSLQGKVWKKKKPRKIEDVPLRSYVLDKKTNCFIDSFIVRTLRPHQIQAIQFMYDCFMGYSHPPFQGCLLGDEMGAGKTLSVLSLLYTLLQRGHPKRPNQPMFKKIVIITPSSLVSHWDSEIVKWFGKARVNPLVVSGKTYNKDPKELINDFGFGYYQVMIISYSLCVHYAESLSYLDSRGKIECIVCDEAHRLKSDQNRTYRHLFPLKTRKRLLITGTPIQNNLSEFYCVLDFLAPGILESKNEFRNYYVKPIVRSKEKICGISERRLGRERCEELNKIVSRVMLRRKMKSLLRNDLPPRNVYVVFLRLVTIQERCYIRLLEMNEMIMANNDLDEDDVGRRSKKGKGSGDVYGSVLGLVQNMKKLLAHPSLVLSLVKSGEGQESQGRTKKRRVERDEDEDDDESDEDEEEEEDDDDAEDEDGSVVFPPIFPTNYDANALNLHDSCKFIKLCELLRKFNSLGDKTIVVSNFTRILDVVERLLSYLQMKYVRLDGSVPSIKRQDIVNRFQRRREARVFLLSSRAGGVGLNLTAANRMILLDPDWNPATDEQAMGRIYRDGQVKPIHIYRFVVSGTIEEKIFQRQMMKKGLGEGIVDDDVDGDDSIVKFGASGGGKREKIRFTKEFLADLFSYDSSKKCSTFATSSSSSPEEGNEKKKMKDEDEEEEEEKWKKKVGEIDREGLGGCLDDDNSIIEFVKVLDEGNDMIVEETKTEIVSMDEKKTGKKRKRVDLEQIDKFFVKKKEETKEKEQEQEEDDDEENDEDDDDEDQFAYKEEFSDEDDEDDLFSKKKKKRKVG